MYRIYFFANFGDWSKLPFGGGEVGNRRTLSFLHQGDFEVVTIPKYLRISNKSFFYPLKLICRIIGNILLYTRILMLGRRKNSIVHIAGFYGVMIYFEYVIITIAKILGYKTVYEMRGGGAEFNYTNGSSYYRRTFKSVLRKADAVFTQGQENIPLIKGINNNCEIFYYPNCVTSDFYPDSYPCKPHDLIRLIYFGRISRAKHTDVVVDTYIRLKMKYKNLHLDIVGDCDDEMFMKYIKAKITQNGNSDFISLWPACNHSKLKEYLRDTHFYIFPSKEPREGHSNALTEAMSWGLIPIATMQGFNRSVIGNDLLIVNELTASAFANRISRIIDNEDIIHLSKEMYNRVIKNYTDVIVSNKIIAEYNRLFKTFFQI